jgi:hypothetical protein
VIEFRSISYRRETRFPEAAQPSFRDWRERDLPDAETRKPNYQSGGNKLRIAGARCGIISLVSPPHQGVSYYL